MAVKVKYELLSNGAIHLIHSLWKKH